jgi:hypothetical protein
MKKTGFLVLSFCFIFLLAGIVMAADISNPLLKKLVEKGILTQEEALSIMQDARKDTAVEEKKVEEKIEQKIAEVKPADKDTADVIKAFKGFKLGLLWFLSYQNGQENNDQDFSRFAIKRGYLTVQKEFMSWFSARMTTEVTQVKDEAKDAKGNVFDNFDGSIAVRMKFLYGQFNIPDLAFLTKPFVEVGIVHMPWLDYEEHINLYRLQDTMFVERNGLFNAADLGVTFASLFGGMMDEDYQKKVSPYYPGRYGSTAFGIYNGGGYASSEKNKNKVFEGRISIRPLPDIVPGLQLTYFGLTGKGNTAAEPDWDINLGFVSYEHEYFTLTGQYYKGKGSQSGSDANNKEGYSFFTEIKPMKKFSIIGRYDYFDPNLDVKQDQNKRYIVGVAYHLDKPFNKFNNMVLLDYDVVNYNQSGKRNDGRIQLTLQVAY